MIYLPGLCCIFVSFFCHHSHRDFVVAFYLLPSMKSYDLPIPPILLHNGFRAECLFGPGHRHGLQLSPANARNTAGGKGVVERRPTLKTISVPGRKPRGYHVAPKAENDLCLAMSFMRHITVAMHSWDAKRNTYLHSLSLAPPGKLWKLFKTKSSRANLESPRWPKLWGKIGLIWLRTPFSVSSNQASTPTKIW